MTLNNVFGEMDCGWTLEQAVEFVRSIQPQMDKDKCPFHVGLWGSTLTKGSSTKDIDVIIINGEGNTSRQMSGEDIRGLLPVNSECLFKVDDSSYGATSFMFNVEAWQVRVGNVNKRVDFFFVKVPQKQETEEVTNAGPEIPPTRYSTISQYPTRYLDYGW